MSASDMRRTMALLEGVLEHPGTLEVNSSEAIDESNMSYCRWSNTAGDMQDCLDAMRAFNEPDAEEYHDPESDEGQVSRTNFEALSNSEKSGYFQALALAAEMLENADPDHLAEAGVNLSRLG